LLCDSAIIELNIQKFGNPVVIPPKTLERSGMAFHMNTLIQNRYVCKTNTQRFGHLILLQSKHGISIPTKFSKGSEPADKTSTFGVASLQTL
jgi:hypothetical protein